VTRPKVFKTPSPLADALVFADQARGQPNCVHVSPGARHWDVYTRLCRGSGARGNVVPDAYLAALAIESGCGWVTTDRDYARFKGPRWRHPLR
jgi:toxin-antitoxin system PIN domain toxin